MALSVTLLALMQAIMMSCSIALFASSPLIGLHLAPNPAWAGLAISLQFLGVLLTLYPISLMMQKYGRKRVFIAANVVGMAGMAMGYWGLHADSFYLFAVQGPLIGMYVASGQFYRFAAADAAPPERKARAISLTLAGGVIAAFLGTNLVNYTIHMTVPDFSATYLGLFLLIGLSTLMASQVRLPPLSLATNQGAEPPRPLQIIMRQKSFIAAALAAMIGFGAMNLMMISAPFAISHEHYEFSLVTTVLQWHAVAMFLPSFFTGDVIKRFGVTKIILTGAAIMVLAVGIAYAGIAPHHFIGSMVLVGLGWNFLYIGGTHLLAQSHHPNEKAKVQGLNDSLVFGTTFVTSLISAQLMQVFGWDGLAVLVLPFLLMVAIAVLFYALAPAAAKS